MRENIKICMISDDNYVMPTCVAIQSIIDCAVHSYDIYIIASVLSQESENCFMNMKTDQVNIHIIRENAEERFRELPSFDGNPFCSATVAVMLKLIIPNVFKEFDKILYLDGDLIVKEDLASLYNLDLGNHYLAAAMDSGIIYWKSKYHKQVQCYFNAGVMLLNLNQMREDNLAEKMICMTNELTDSFLLDQDILNLVCDHRYIQIPIKYNYMPISLERSYHKWSVDQINEAYGTHYAEKADLMKDAAIIHYASIDKPWKIKEYEMRVACADEWIKVYKKTPIKHELLLPHNSEECQYMVSVIIPCYNVEKYVQEAIYSLMKQSYQDFEIICIDDGSTDTTLSILNECKEKYSNITVISDSKHGLAYQRNNGLKYAKGKYIYFFDSNDILDPKSLQIMVDQMETNALDLLFFEGQTFFENETLKEKMDQFKDLFHRKNWYPNTYTGKDLFVKLRQRGEFLVGVDLQMVRKKYLDENGIGFPELNLMEDNMYTFNALFYAERVKCLPDILFYRRVIEDSTMTSSNHLLRIDAMKYSAAQLMKLLPVYFEDKNIYSALCQQLCSFFQCMFTSFESLTSEEKESLLKEENDDSLLLKACLLVMEREMILTETNMRLQKINREKSEINRKLQETYREKLDSNHKIQVISQEKSEINRKLQETYREKSEINRKLQETYREKSEINRKLQETYREKSEINRKLQETYQEKTARRLKIEELSQKNRLLNQENQKIKKEIQEIKNSFFYKIYKKINGKHDIKE